MSSWLAHEKETTQKLLRDSILQACRLNVGTAGSYEVDGIICITRGGGTAGDSCDDEQIVVKVHEQVILDSRNGTNMTQRGDASILREYLAGHMNPYLTPSEVRAPIVPLVNFKRKATNDENDNAIIAFSQQPDSVVLGHPENKILKQNVFDSVDSSLRSMRDRVSKLSAPKNETPSEDEENVGERFQCGKCLFDFESLDGLQQHYLKFHGCELEHYCNECCVAFADAADLGKHTSAMHVTQPLSSARRRKQKMPRRGVVGDTANSVEDGNGDESDAMENLSNVGAENDPLDVSVRRTPTYMQSVLLKRPTAMTLRGGDSPVPAFGAVNSGAVMDAGAERMCMHCGAGFTNFMSFSNHCQSEHHRFPCPYCIQTFTQRVNRDRHLYNHTGEKPFLCAVCGFGFTRRDALRKHQAKANHQGVTTDLSRVFDVRFPVMAEKWELSDDFQVGDGDASSSECGLDLSMSADSSSRLSKEELTRDFLSANIKTEDDNQALRQRLVPNFSSPIRTSGSSASLVAHYSSIPSNIASETSDSEGTVRSQQAADVDGDGTQTKRGVPARLWQSNTNRPYSCDQCHETVMGAIDFEVHCRNVHRRTPCVYCGKTFSQKGNMERHQRQHTGERPFCCPHCPCSYTRKETLKVHINQAHPEVGNPVANSHVSQPLAVVVAESIPARLVLD